jgi:hypothetical protein
MISRTWSRKSIAFSLAVAVLSVYSMVVLATPGQTGPSGELSVSGQVTVNGQNAISGATVFSDSTITTAKGSSAVVSLGKLGRVEVMPESTVKISFTDAGITSMLEAGRVRVSNSSMASVATTNGTAVADNAAVFTVDVECGDTKVATQSGNVMLRGGGADKQVAAGTNASVGQEAPGTRCTRLKTEGMKGIGGGALAALILAAGGAVAAAVIAGTSENNDIDLGGGTTVVSPTK